MLYKILSDNTRSIVLVVQDFNVEVLRLVTMPNLLLQWAFYSNILPKDKEFGTWRLTSADKANFRLELVKRDTTLRFIHGPWSSRMDVLLEKIIKDHPPCITNVISSETIYSPNYLKHFICTLKSALHHSGQAIIAAKRFYFGVGGSMQEAIDVMHANGLITKSIEEIDAIGIGRIILSVSHAETENF